MARWWLLLTATALLPAQDWPKRVIAQGFACHTAVAADFTGDGRLDVITNDTRQTILYTAPDWKPTVLHTGLWAIHAAVMDADADGDPDFVGAQYSPGVIFWLERPDDPLKSPWRVHLIDSHELGGINGIHGIAAGDINGDGKPDLAATSAGPGPWANSLAWFEIPSNPRERDGWPRHITGKGEAPGLIHYVAIGDVDGDGRADLATGAKFPPDGNYFAWWRQPASAVEPWKKTVAGGFQEGATNILMADLNGDGKTDLVASRGHGFGVIWLEAPNWDERPIDASLGGPHSLAIGNIAGKGLVDVATCAKNTMQCAWYENDGRGKFRKNLISQNQAAYDVRLIDMDADGDLDLLVAGQDSRNLVWYENPRLSR